MKAQVREQRQLCPVRYHQVFINDPQAPVEHANQHFERRRTYRQRILYVKQMCRGCKISQGAGCEGKSSDGKADDGEVLKMPAIGDIDGCRIVDEPDVGEGEGGEA